MEEIKDPVIEEVTENAEGQTAEETVEPEKVYTEEEFNAKLDKVLAKKIARNNEKIRKEYEKKYGNLENVLKAGTGIDDIGDITEQFTDFYQSKGIQIPKPADYSDKDLKVLAKAEASDIISLGFDEVVEEVDRLADLGINNMTAREKLVFAELANYRKAEEDRKELAKIGVGEESLKDAEFIEFAKNLDPNLSTKKKWEIFAKYKPKKDIEVMGSMKNSGEETAAVKDFYTREEALKFTKKDFDKNPALYEAVEKSSYKW